jgi:hypothetical protein
MPILAEGEPNPKKGAMSVGPLTMIKTPKFSVNLVGFLLVSAYESWSLGMGVETVYVREFTP